MARRTLRQTGVIAVFGLAIIGVMTTLAGDLDPPAGPVAPTMKTLDEVEPRIALNQVNTPGNSGVAFLIPEPGSYYLTEDTPTVTFQGGIDVPTGGVTIDLNGFTLRHGGVFDPPHCRLYRIGRHWAFFERATDPAAQALFVERGAATVLFNNLGHGQLGVLVGRKTFLARCAFAPTANLFPVTDKPRVDYACIVVLAKWAMHGAMLTQTVHRAEPTN